MEEMQDYFPTKAYRYAVARMQTVLRKEKARLESLGVLDWDSCKKTLPEIISFSKKYQEAFNGYLKAVLVQHPNKVKCGPDCGNCCRHYPMSIEPFEQIHFYTAIRERSDLLSILEACYLRVEKFSLFENLAKNAEKPSEDPEEDALHQFFESGFPCPFLTESKSCGVYESRPVTCRMYFSETLSKYCTAEFLRTEKNRSFIVYLPDEIEMEIAEISKYYENLNLPESLYEGVLELNSLEGNLFS